MVIIKATTGYLKRHPFFGEFLNENSIGLFKKYLVIGFSSFALEYIIYLIFTDLVRIWYLYASTIAQAIVFCYNFLMNRYWSFQSRMKLSRQLLRYGVIFLFNVGMSNLLIYLLKDILGLNYYLSKVLVMGAIVSWTFIIYKKFIFLTNPGERNEAL
jgi:putative flippase GtrA